MNLYDGFAVDTTDQIIRCAIEVHRHLGPGLLESVYESAICIELESAGLTFARQVGVPLFYKGELIAEHRPDLIVGDQVVVEIKEHRALQSSVRRTNAHVLARHRTA